MRKLTPELLDHLPHDDPGAIRSRRDLARVNRFMGNESWIIRSIAGASPTHISELGAGDATLLTQLARLHPQAEIHAYDLAPRPNKLPESVTWHRGDLLLQPPPAHGGTLIANLFLHHLSDSQLDACAPWLASFDTLIFNEPLRARLPLVLAKVANPFIHPITRHDMRVSIEAGFLPGELRKLLNLDPIFSIAERPTLRGSLRMFARKGFKMAPAVGIEPTT